MISTGDDLKDARIALGLSLNEMRRALRLRERGVAYLMRMEAGTVDVSGPVAVAVEALLREAGLIEGEHTK